MKKPTIYSLTTTTNSWGVGEPYTAVALRDTNKPGEGSIITYPVDARVTRIESVLHDNCSPSAGLTNRDFNVFGYVHRAGKELVLATINGSCVESIAYDVGDEITLNEVTA